MANSSQFNDHTVATGKSFRDACDLLKGMFISKRYDSQLVNVLSLSGRPHSSQHSLAGR